MPEQRNISMNVSAGGSESAGSSHVDRRRVDGRTKLEFCRRLGATWTDLATVAEIPDADLRRFAPGDQPREIWTWLEVRGRLAELPGLLETVDRPDLAGLFGS